MHGDIGAWVVSAEEPPFLAKQPVYPKPLRILLQIRFTTAAATAKTTATATSNKQQVNSNSNKQQQRLSPQAR